eukprot:TRINITY_DN4342_c0_g1_i3.p3 TRINITY_DN4342_c0_g1~~TRINITY_DN4342_c0_g1_i3.p3  ORF type:complete len:179 (+),score=42.68 TRINITY_DN4342_c0_g1_i3:37-537(+)
MGSLAGTPPNPLPGTVKPYQRHVFVCTPGQTNWPSKAESQGFAQLVAERCKQLGVPASVRTNSCNWGATAAQDSADLLVFPEQVVYRAVTAATLETVIRVHLLGGTVAAELGPESVSNRLFFFVCTHASRDDRCGRTGPTVAAELRRLLAQRRQVPAAASSNPIPG